jgi:HEAT repeat protein
MGLKKTSEAVGLRRIEPRDYARDGQGLLEQLRDPDVSIRRWAARDLVDHPTLARSLCDHLAQESDGSVREVMFTTLGQIGGLLVVQGLLPLLRSEDANLRNGAIETLAGMPSDVGPSVDHLLMDGDVDVRIFTVNLLGDLRHPRLSEWLAQVLKDDAHVNVVAAALEVAAEIGGGPLLPAVKTARSRFADDPFIGFAADLAQQRIEAA